MRDWSAALTAFAEVEDNPDPIVCNAMLHAADKCNKFHEAFELYEEVLCKAGHPKQAATYTPLIRLAGRHGQLAKARSLLTEMRQSSVTPNAHTCSALVDTHKVAGDNHGAWCRWQEMRAASVGVDAISLSSIMSVVAKSGDALATEELLREAEGNFIPDVTHTNCILDACKRSGDAETAFRVLKAHRARNVAPDIISYTCVLGALRRACQSSEQVDRIIMQMKQDSVAPNRFFVEEQVACILGISLEVSDLGLEMEALPEDALREAARIIQESHAARIQLTKLTRDVERNLESILRSRATDHDWAQVLTKSYAGSDTNPSVYYWDRLTGKTQWERPPGPLNATVTASQQ